jgi:hypothetical protein
LQAVSKTIFQKYLTPYVLKLPKTLPLMVSLPLVAIALHLQEACVFQRRLPMLPVMGLSGDAAMFHVEHHA